MKCSRCGHDNPAAQKFCGNCGELLAPAEPSARPSMGERKLLTVLFADVVGSTAMGEKLDPEEIADIMNGAFALFNAAVTAYGGTVARLMGDAVLAFFGAPLAHEDDAERAVRAALEIQKAARSHARDVLVRYGLEFEVRVGINTGLAVLDVVGDQARTEYTAMGDTTNVASRLQSAAEPGAVLISASTYQLVKNLFDFKPRGAIELKGKSASMEVYEVLGAKATPGKLRGLEGLSSPLVGRDRQLSNLQARLDDLRAGHGSLVTVSGEAGLGKSRLVAELKQAVELGTAPVWLEARAVSYGQAVSYYSWKQILHQAIDARDNETPARVREKLRTACAGWALPDDDMRFLEAMLGIADDESQKVVGKFEGDSLVRRITDATLSFVHRALTMQAPAVLVFDDLHWADNASLDLLLRVCELSAEQPLLIIALLRPDQEAPSWQFVERARQKLGARVHAIDLEPLPPEDARTLLGNLLYIEDLPGQVRELVLQKSEGNPFFVEEVIRSLIDSRHIVRENSHWRATHEIASVSIPNTLAGVLGSRIDRLPDDTKRVVQMASVLGRSFAYAVLKAICDGAPPAERIGNIDTHLAALTHEDILRLRAQQPELEYTFKHALTQEAAYNSLLIKRRKEFHRRAGTALMELYAERLDEFVPLLAQHFYAGEEWSHAADFAVRAGDNATKVYALREALDHYERALSALEKLPDAPPEKVIDATLGWCQAAIQFRPHSALFERLLHAEQIARAQNDKRRLARILHWTANVHFADGSTSRAAPYLFENFEIASELGDERLSIVPSYYMAFFMVARDPRGALAQLDRVIQMARKLGNYDIEAHALATKALAHGRLGEFELAKEEAQTALAYAGRRSSPIPEADLYNLAGFVYLDVGDTERAAHYGQLGAEKALAVNAIECAAAGNLCIALSHLQKQNLPAAQQAFADTIRLADFSGSEPFRNVGQGGLALAQFIGGSPQAIQGIKSAHVNAQTLDDQYSGAMFAQVLGDIHMQDGRLAEAERYFALALDYYRANGMRTYMARALQSQSRLFKQQGRTVEAEQAASEAMALLSNSAN
jgi:class 3 adenylate cyclase/tetratricopeptide (TPR) repeat protein